MLFAAAGCGSSSTTATAPTSTSPYTQTDLVIGTGATANTGNRVTVAYTGWLYDTSKTDSKGTQFDANASFLFTLGAGTVIKGWDQGVVGMKIGGQRRLIIPPELAYGSGGSGTIPGNATLIFDIALLNVQ
ncbi:MAG: FKBP-type peptidyl-prolyl cis-trans isomerase [Acidobacteria bacterium]|nr:FKBP-type peptidyl-prolyl cis-trans isomerase [Acidobacteriota bacterium]